MGLNVEWVIPCRFAEVHDNLGTIVGAGIDTFWVPSFPTPLQVVLAVRLTGFADELREDVEHNARNVITDPSGQVIGDENATFNIGMPDAKADWLNAIMLVSAVVFQATSPGTYTLEHIVDGTSKSVPFHVIEGFPPAAEPPAA